MLNLLEEIKKLDVRPEWNDYFILNSYLISKRSSCERLHVGCVIVKDRRILSTGYNGHIKGSDHVSKIVNGHEQMTIHAEINAISDAAARGVEINGSTVYVTHYPCVNCTKALIAAGVKEICYAEDYKNDKIAEELFTIGKVTVSKHQLTEPKENKLEEKK